MMSLLGVTAVMISGLVAQLLTPGMARLAGAKAPVLLAIVVYYALTRPRSSALAIAFWSGLLVDVLSPIPLGFSAACYVVVALVVGCFRNLVFDDTIITPAFFGGVASFAVTLALYALLVTRGGYAGASMAWIVVKAVATAGLGVLVTPPVFVAARSMDHVLRALQRRPV